MGDTGIWITRIFQIKQMQISGIIVSLVLSTTLIVKVEVFKVSKLKRNKGDCYIPSECLWDLGLYMVFLCFSVCETYFPVEKTGYTQTKRNVYPILFFKMLILPSKIVIRDVFNH